MSVDYIGVRHDDRALTVRELQALTLYACGLTYRQIAERMGRTPSTVGSHLDAVRGKLRVHSTADAVQVALDAGLIPVEVAP